MIRPRSLSRFSALEGMMRSFSPFERLALYVFTLLLGVSTLALLAGANSAVSVTIPSQGGAIVEGELGPARFINPLIPMSQADSDIAALVYSGLTRSLPDGSIISDLASSYEISDDGTSYTFTIREGSTFHDGTPVTSADVLFTVQQAQNPDIKSIHRADWEGVSVSTPDERTVIFKLPRAYAPFIQNTTMGILPKHLWASVTPEEFPFSPINMHPIGTGRTR
ncbi:MAG: peptide/nickel transport system substrate-binding protein [Parcubacteria group bacterium Athens0416_74]|nr:MAG: peptide/nickel transport system substrate-binding protein [Parcubacteria group bacterium Athens0416_74]